MTIQVFWDVTPCRVVDSYRTNTMPSCTEYSFWNAWPCKWRRYVLSDLQ